MPSRNPGGGSVFFAEFTSSSKHPRKGAKHYIVAKDARTLLIETNGMGFGQVKFMFGRQVTESEVRKANLPFFDRGLQTIRCPEVTLVYLGHTK